MPKKKTTSADWSNYFTLLKDVERALHRQKWFDGSWGTVCKTWPDRPHPRGILLLFRKDWIAGSIDGVPYPALIHFKTRITQSDIDAKTIRIGLHVETNQKDHGINRVTFMGEFLARAGNRVASWPGYVVKPRHYQKPFHTRVPWTDKMLAQVLLEEFGRAQQVADAIDEAIMASRK